MNNNYKNNTSYTQRRKTRTIHAGPLTVGGYSPIRIQSMTNTPTQDTSATLNQTIALAEAGCELVRVTAQNIPAAQSLKNLRKQFSQAGFSHIPICADIHFLPKAALEAIEHVEKVRVNPGNYIDKKKFLIKEYSNAQYQEELDRLHEAFSPLVLRTQQLGKCLRIGTNHGSLSDRIMNRYGDTPLGMVESALEFARIARSHNFHNFCFSFKASNVKIMIQAYRLAAQKMTEEDMDYPLHLGVTEAGDGEDGRVKSAIGIGSLLADGIGDTIRVSLTENPVYEIPVAQSLASQAHKIWESNTHTITPPTHINTEKKLFDPFLVLIKPNHHISEHNLIIQDTIQTNNTPSDAKIEGLSLNIQNESDLIHFDKIQNALSPSKFTFALDLPHNIHPPTPLQINQHTYIYTYKNPSTQLIQDSLKKIKNSENTFIALNISPDSNIKIPDHPQIILTSTTPSTHHYRQLTQKYPTLPIWIRTTSPEEKIIFSEFLLYSSTFAGSLLADNIGSLISIEHGPPPNATNLAYSILQATKTRITKTEFIACPSCGRTLFNLEETTQAIRAKTNHLVGVTIAIMGCIVNGPGEMADADFGYVGGAPGKINLYVGKKCVKYNIPQENAVDELILLIKHHNKWTEPPVTLNNKYHDPLPKTRL